MRLYTVAQRKRRNALRRKNRRANPDRYTREQREWWLRNQTRVMLYHAKARAKELGVPFNLTLADIVIPVMCPVDGLPLEDGRGKGRKASSPRSPTLDRRVPALGYTKGNVQVISNKWNARKSNMTADDLRMLLRYVEGDDMRAFHGARQGTQSAVANQAPGFVDPTNPARTAKSPANTDSPVVAAASMHDGLGEETQKLANGSSNVPIHPAMVPSEGADTQETEGDGSVRDPTGIGRGT